MQTSLRFKLTAKTRCTEELTTYVDSEPIPTKCPVNMLIIPFAELSIDSEQHSAVFRIFIISVILSGSVGTSCYIWCGSPFKEFIVSVKQDKSSLFSKYRWTAEDIMW